MVPLRLLAVLAFASIAGAEEFSQFTATGLPEFWAVESFLPYAGAVHDSDDGTYSATLYGPKNVTDVAKAEVSGSSVLNFGLTTGIPKENQSWSLYNYTIRVPAGTLKSFGSDVATSLKINGTAAASSFSVRVKGPGGSAKLAITNLASRIVNVNTTGFGSTVIRTTEEVSVLNYNATGHGSSSITGFSGTLNSLSDGLYNLMIGPSSESLAINAFITGDTPTKVSYSNGSCTVLSTGPAAYCMQSPTPSLSVITAG